MSSITYELNIYIYIFYIIFNASNNVKKYKTKYPNLFIFLNMIGIFVYIVVIKRKKI